MTAIRLEKLKKAYGETVAVADVDLDLKKGELTFLLGPSGCGKTTILRMIAGFIEPTAGRILFDGKDVSGLPANQRNTGMVFQSYALWPHMTVAENVAFGLEVRKRPTAEVRTKVNEALEMVKMGHLGARRPTELSGGQQQRVALARALVFTPSVLLLDEPLSNLDAKLRLEMRTEIRRIVSEIGITAVYVTHDQEEALSVADCMVVLKDGHVMQHGRPSDLYRRPYTKFVADFLGETNFVPGTVKESRDIELLVDTPIGPLTARGLSTASRRSGAVTLSIRPETLQIGGRSHNTIAAEHLSTIYLGKAAQHRLRAGNATATPIELKALEGNPREVPGPGERTTLSVDPEDVVVLGE
ncbi:MAG: ABC transporter ATP-binding protein [Phycisphaerae bacterium]|jgi:iron(III) transport system ATP-binding protein|nr:ABC transporter ATP-binding protein [Phycisphaerae bacterium]